MSEPSEPSATPGAPPGALPAPLQTLLQRFREGRRIALARAISLVEGEREGFEDFLHAALSVGLAAERVGLTGPPGAGKSSLVAQLASAFRAEDRQVGIVAVDPTSPFSGGALLGDRIRMNDLATDAGIFIRSMATRGSLGGLAAATREVMDLMDAFGMGRLIVETVGVGQTELEITAAADTVVVVLVPESGDSIQAMKAGLMEIADIFVINKADRPGADRLAKEIRLALHLREGEALRDVPAHHGVSLDRLRKERAERRAAERQGPLANGGVPTGDDSSGAEALTWEIPVLKTVAQTGEGVPELLEQIALHERYLVDSGELERRRRARATARVVDVVERELGRRVWTAEGADEILENGVDRIRSGTATPYSIANELMDNLLAASGGRRR